ncbi:unnamed protein product [Ixodes persulcatus]
MKLKKNQAAPPKPAKVGGGKPRKLPKPAKTNDDDAVESDTEDYLKGTTLLLLFVMQTTARESSVMVARIVEDAGRETQEQRRLRYLAQHYVFSRNEW